MSKVFAIVIVGLRLLACSPTDSSELGEALQAVDGTGLEVRPASLTLAPGVTKHATALIDRQQQSQAGVSLAIDGAPPGIDVVFRENPTTELSNIDVAVAPGVPDGDYVIAVRAWSSDGFDAAQPLQVLVRTPPPLQVEVDPSLVVDALPLPPYEDGEYRPLARLADDFGRPVDFVANELIISSDDDAEVQRVLERTHGHILATGDVRQSGIDAPRLTLVRLETIDVDVEHFADDLRDLNRDVRAGRLRVSSEEGRRLLAFATREFTEHVSVSINWIAQGDGFADRLLFDGPNAWDTSTTPPKIVLSYDSNPVRWPMFSHATPTTPSVQNIGVVEAWRALALAGKIDGPKVMASVIDGGFRDYDLPSFIGVTANPLAGAFGASNPSGCGGTACPWHGTNVTQAGFGIAGNSFGGAGPGGPVSRMFLIHNTGDFFTNMLTVPTAAGAGARIINMSFSARVPVTLSWSVLPFNEITKLVRLSGTLIFASAGNDNEDVDEYSCFGGCWEVAWHTPCENAGVDCIGGIDWNSKNIAAFGAAGGSNYGYDGTVVLFAPWTTYVGITPDQLALGYDARWFSGTSASSPFVAGVAALVWAADPTLADWEVEDRLIDYANPSPDAKVVRYVNAYASVHAALGNVRPVVKITSPSAGASIDYGGLHTMSFTATVDDLEDGSTGTIVWTSNVDGALGTGSTIGFTFPTRGARTITASVTDSSGAIGSASISVYAFNSDPVATIIKPTTTTTVYRGVPTTFEGKALDTNQLTLPCTSLYWSNMGGEAFSTTGCMPTVTFTVLGPHLIYLYATDAYGATSTATASFSVIEPPPGMLIVSITSPAPGAWLYAYSATTLSGTSTNPGGGALTYQWSVIDGGIEHVIGTGATLSWTPNVTLGPSCSARTVTLRLRVTAAGGGVGEATRDVVANFPPC